MREPKLLTVGDLLGAAPLMPIWPDFGRDVCQISRANTFRLAGRDELPVPVVCLGGNAEGRRGKRFVRTADVMAWLHLTDVNEAAADATVTASSERPIATSK